MEERIKQTSCEGEFLTDEERADPERKVYHYLAEPADNRSVMEMLAELSVVNPVEYEKVVEELLTTKGEEWIKGLPYDWTVNSRPKQRIPTPKDRWRFWVILAGRGWGKTKTGAETVVQWVEAHPAGVKPLRIALVGATTSDVNGVMVSGDSGILSCYPEKMQPHWTTSTRRLTWYNPDGTTKAIAECFSAEEPERLRGPQFHKAWLDELAAWRYEYALEMLRFGLRLGDNPQAIVTTTPRPFPILLNLLKEEGTWTTKGSTYENRSNLAPAFFDEVINKYKGTRLGEQELMAEILDGVKDAMWNEVNLDNNRIEFHELHKLPELLSIVLAIDPATTTRTSSAETGMCVAAYGENDHFYILHLSAMKESPETWARAAIKLFNDYKCDKMIAEVNNGGDLVEAVIRAANPMQKVFAVHASRGKTTRAEPIAALYEQNRVHHVGRFPNGEQQMCSFNPIENPYGNKDMVDALVWAMTYLVDITQGRNQYRPAIGGERTKMNNYKRIFRY